MDVKFLWPGVVLCVTIASAMAPSPRDDAKGMQEYGAERIALPEPKYTGATSVEEALKRRRSVRVFKEGPVLLAELSQLIWAAQGITEPGGFRTAPSAGALYPLELYVLAGNVTGLQAGIYKYAPERNELFVITKGDRRNDLCSAALGQSSIRNAPLVLVLSGVYERTTVKYGERGVRYVHMEAGHAAQNVCLQAVSLQLGTVVIGAFRDEDVRRLLGVTDRGMPLYILPVGRK